MIQPNVKRKLTAILSADVEGYSRLMGEDEVSTIRTLKWYKEAITKLVANYRGRVVDAPGDNMLAEFVSVVDAVQCAVDIQREIAECNEESSQECKMYFRIGVNLGDVVEEENRIYGEGVNIAARVEALAEKGGICVTGAVYDQVKNRVRETFDHIGKQKVKNIAEPIEVYRIKKIAHFASKSDTEQTHAFKFPPLPEKPSVAVLPFENFTGDKDQEFIGDGIAESIIIALSSIGDLFVIARNSVFSYKNEPISVERISAELGVRYILGGSVLKAGKRIRITARLVDTSSGRHIWTEQFDREMTDFFKLLDEVAQRTTVSLQVKLTHGAQALRTLDTKNFIAWGNYVKAAGHFQRFTNLDNSKARELLSGAVESDPDFAVAWILLAWTFFVDVRFGFSKSPEESIQRAVELAKKATSLNDQLPEVYSFWNTVHLVQGQFAKAITEGEKSIKLGPNNAVAHILLSQTMRFAGEFQDSIKYGEIAVRLCPRCPAWYLVVLASAYIEAGRFDQGISILTEALERSRKGEMPSSHAFQPLIVAYVRLGRADKAKWCAQELMASDPLFTLNSNSEQLFYKDSKLQEAYLKDLRTAGLK